MKHKFLLSCLAIATLPTIGSAQTNIQLKSGEVLYHNTFPLTDSSSHDIFKTDTEYANTVIMSNLIAGVMYGELIKQKYPKMSFNKDYLYNSLIGQLMQESDMSSQINDSFKINDPEQLIDNSIYSNTLLSAGQGGPYQINDYSKRLPNVGTEGSLGLVNYNAIAKILGYSITAQDDGSQTKLRGPVALENIYSGPMITAFYHFNDINRMNINAKQNWYVYHQQWQECLNASQDPKNTTKNLAFPFAINVVYNAGSYSPVLKAYLDICSNPNQQTYDKINSWTLDTTAYQEAIGVDNPSSGPATYYRYPRQVSFYINQIINNNDSKLANTGVSVDNQVIVAIADLKNTFALIMHKLSYRDSNSKLQFITTGAANQAFEQAIQQATKTYGKIPNDLDFSNNPNTQDHQRQIIYDILENAITNLSQQQNIDFSKTFDKQPGPAPKPQFTYPNGIGHYQTGTVVKAGGSEYQCLVAAWCNQPTYSPTGAYSNSAWKNLNPPKQIGTWEPNKAYDVGDTVTINNVTYQAQWWSKGDNPINNHDQGQPWKIINQ